MGTMEGQHESCAGDSVSLVAQLHENEVPILGNNLWIISSTAENDAMINIVPNGGFQEGAIASKFKICHKRVKSLLSTKIGF